MFIGMGLGIIVHSLIGKCDEKDMEHDLETQNEQGETKDIEKSESKWKTYFYVAAPSLCDLTASTIMNIGLLYIEASVWSMLKGSMVIFSLAFCVYILKRPHYAYMWWSVLIIVVAVTIVGFAAVASTGVKKSGASQGQVVLAIFLTVISQFIQATQIVVEDFLLHDVSIPPILLVGLEGVWGTILTSMVFLPILQFTGDIKTEGNGVHEDSIDTYYMIKNSPILMAFIGAGMLAVLVYNITGTFVTNMASAVVRTILEGFKTLCIWIAQLALYYSLRNTQYGKDHPDIGEKWTKYSWIQLVGFAILFTGMMAYNRVIKLPGLKYPAEMGSKMSDQPLIGNQSEK